MDSSNYNQINDFFSEQFSFFLSIILAMILFCQVVPDWWLDPFLSAEK
jgi:hypothetical protein